MSDYISREALIKHLCNKCDGYCDCVECDCLNCNSENRCDIVKEIAEFPADDAIEKLNGWWKMFGALAEMVQMPTESERGEDSLRERLSKLERRVSTLDRQIGTLTEKFLYMQKNMRPRATYVLREDGKGGVYYEEKKSEVGIT